MRILHVLAERGFSGGEHQLRLLVEHLARRGHRQTLILNRDARFASVARELGLEVHEVAMRNDADVVAVARLRKRFRALAPELIHLGCSRSHKLGALAAWRLGLPSVVTRRMDYPLGRGAFRRWLYGRAVTAVVAVSEGVRREVLATGADPQRVHVIADGVDTEHIAACTGTEERAAARASLGLPDGTVCGLTAASLHRRKGQDVLLSALQQVVLPKGVDRLVWICAGEGPLREELLSAAERLPAGIEVRFPGRVDVEPLLAACDLFCLPSRKEGLGVALLEAMAAGRPAVASAVGGMLEAVVDGESGMLVPTEDVAALAAALERLLGDPSMRRRLGDAARGRVQSHFSAKQMCERSEALYVRLASSGRLPG